MAGQLTDVFVIAREAENTALVSILLRAPGDGDMPPRGPKGFDISARAYPLAGDALAVWKEFGRWVFSSFIREISFTAKPPRSPPPARMPISPGKSASRSSSFPCRASKFRPPASILWSSSDTIDPAALSAAFRAPVEVSPRPAPVLPDPLSKLLPADVRAARREANRRKNIILGVAAVALLYLGIIGWFGYGLWKDSSETKKLLLQAKEAAPEGEAYALHIAKWDELADAIDLANSPVDILKRVADCIPPNSGLRLKTADISASEVKLIGEAPQFQAVKPSASTSPKTPTSTNSSGRRPSPTNPPAAGTSNTPASPRPP